MKGTPSKAPRTVLDDRHEHSVTPVQACASSLARLVANLFAVRTFACSNLLSHAETGHGRWFPRSSVPNPWW